MGLRRFLRREPTPTLTPREGDRRILEELRNLGADLSRPRHVIQYLYFPDEEGARGAAATLAASGYEVRVNPPGDAVPDWNAIAETHVVVDERWVDEMRPRFEAVAAANGGEYDGWEAAGD
jgi:regulator of ribonuclease activity B